MLNDFAARLSPLDRRVLHLDDRRPGFAEQPSLLVRRHDRPLGGVKPDLRQRDSARAPRRRLIRHDVADVQPRVQRAA
jgi:hypothetical protein